jgi:hypothetical protein
LTNKAAAETTIPGVSSPGRFSILKVVLPVVLLAIVTCLAYANAWPNALVFDDKLFVDYQRFSDYSAIPRYFSEDAWPREISAAVFGVHPMHTEVVNSIFNRSIMLAALGVTAGLWWLMRYLESKPLLAAAPIVLSLFLLIPVSWARNADWASEITLFESDYSTGVHTPFLLRLLTEK